MENEPYSSALSRVECQNFMSENRPERKAPGPDPKKLRIEGENWEDSVKKALQKKRPEKGWPKPEKEKP